MIVDSKIQQSEEDILRNHHALTINPTTGGAEPDASSLGGAANFTLGKDSSQQSNAATTEMQMRMDANLLCAGDV